MCSSLASLFVESGVVEHAEVLMVTQHLKVRVYVAGLGQIEFGLRITIAELNAVFVLIYLKHSDLADNLASSCRLLFLLLLLGGGLLSSRLQGSGEF